jgi:hypothetical protein
VTHLALPRDHKLFALCSSLAQKGLAYLEKHLSDKRYVSEYDSLPSLDWSADGMPQFSFFGNERPDYKSAFNYLSFNYLWGRAASALDGSVEQQFDFSTHPEFQELKTHVFSTSQLVGHFLHAQEGDKDFDLFGTSLKVFIEIGIDRYVHTINRTTFDPEKYLEIYLPLEAGLLLEPLPIEIHTPILSVEFSNDVFQLSDSIAISRMSTPLQLARAYRDRETHEVSPGLLNQASHSLVLTDYVIPNSDRFFTVECTDQPEGISARHYRYTVRLSQDHHIDANGVRSITHSANWVGCILPRRFATTRRTDDAKISSDATTFQFFAWRTRADNFWPSNGGYRETVHCSRLIAALGRCQSPTATFGHQAFEQLPPTRR